MIPGRVSSASAVDVGVAWKLRDLLATDSDLSALLQLVIAVYVFAFFTGLDRAVLEGLLTPALRMDWLRQAYNLGGMTAFGLLSLRIERTTIGPALLNLVLIPFNRVNPFVTRIGLGFWFGYSGEVTSFRLLHQAAAVGVVVGTTIVIADAFYVTLFPTARTFGAGLFINPNYVACVALGMPFLVQTSYPGVWATAVVVACIFSGSNSAMLAFLLAAPLTFGWASIRVIATGALIAVLFALTFTTPLNYTYKTPARIVYAVSLGDGAVHSLFGIRGLSRAARSPGSFPRQGSSFNVWRGAPDSAVEDRALGVSAFAAQGRRLLFPLSPVRANDIRHIGIELYIATYGAVLCGLYLFLAYKALPGGTFIFFCALLPIFTDPLFEFGIGFLALRAIWPTRSAWRLPIAATLGSIISAPPRDQQEIQN